MSDGTEYVIDVRVPGQPQLDAAARSVDSLVAAQGEASKAVIATSDAIKAGEASYAKAERAADAAAKALERIGVAAAAQRGKLQAAMETGDNKGAETAAKNLRSLNYQQNLAAKVAAETSTALKAEAAAFDKLKPEVEAAGEAHEKGEIKLGGLARGLKHLGGPLGEGGAKLAEFGHAWEHVSESLGAAGKIAAVSVAVVALAAVFLELTRRVLESVVEFGKWAVELGNAERSANLLSQGIARSVSGGAALNTKIDELTKTLPLTREELSATAQRLADAGLRGDNLTNALTRSATAAAKLKFGPDFAKEMLSLDEQSKVFSANLSGIFGNLKIEGLLAGIQKLGALFDADTESGNAIKVVFESLFQPLVDGVTGIVPKVERFFLKFETMAVKALTTIKPYGSLILKIGEALVIGAAIIVGTFVAAVALAMGVVAGLVAALGAVGVALASAYGWLTAFGTSIGNFFKGLDMGAMGKALIDGLVNGIANGAGAVLAAMKGVVTGAVDGAKKLLGIASPSKVFAEIGEQTGAGMSVGVEKSADGVQGSLEKMVAPPAASGGAAPAAGGSGGGRSNSLSGVTFNFYGVEGAASALEDFKDAFTKILEGDAAQLGAAVPVS